MRVTDVKIRKIQGTEDGVKIRAYADITLEESLVIHGVKVVEGAKGVFVAMPSRKVYSGEFKDIVHPITEKLREEISKSVMEKFQEALEENKI